MIRQNLGKRDRFLWILIGIILVLVAFYKLNFWVWQGLSAFVGTLFLISGVTGFSMIYHLLGHSSKGYGIDRITKKDIERAVKEYGLKTEPVVKVRPVKAVKKKPTKKVAKKTIKKVTKKTTKKTTKNVVKKPTKKVTKKTAKKATKKVTKKVTNR